MERNWGNRWQEMNAGERMSDRKLYYLNSTIRNFLTATHNGIILNNIIIIIKIIVKTFHMM